MRKLSILFAASLLATGCANSPAEQDFLDWAFGCRDASTAQEQAWAYSQDLLIPLTGSDTVARLSDNSAEREQLAAAHTQSMMQVIMIGMELTRAGCPNEFIGTPESLEEAYSETGKTKPSWPSPNEPADEGTQLVAE